MIYIVAGLPRSGTSMLMGMCQSGGMAVVSNPDRAKAVFSATLPSCPTCGHETPKASRDKFRLNPGDVYESSNRERAKPQWPRQHDGKAVKAVTGWLGQLAVHEYKVCFLHRNLPDVQESVRRAFGQEVSCAALQNEITEGLRTLKNRADVASIVELRYEDILTDSAWELSKLDWPMDVTAAAGMVDTEWRTNASHQATG